MSRKPSEKGHLSARKNHRKTIGRWWSSKTSTTEMWWDFWCGWMVKINVVNPGCHRPSIDNRIVRPETMENKFEMVLAVCHTTLRYLLWMSGFRGMSRWLVDGGFQANGLSSGKRCPKKTNWKDPPCLMGKSTISTGPFSSSQTVNVYQRVTTNR